MKRPDLEMIRLLKKKGNFIDLSDALNLPFFYLSHKNMCDFEFALGDDVRETRTLERYGNGQERRRWYLGKMEWVYDRFVISSRDNVLSDYKEGAYASSEEKVVKYWGIIEPTEERDYVYLAYQYVDDTEVREWDGYFERSGLKDDLHEDVVHITPRENESYAKVMQTVVEISRKRGIMTEDYETHMRAIRAHVNAFYRFAGGLMSHLKYGDKHAVEVTPNKATKVSSVMKKERPWSGATGPHVLLLDRMPTTQTEGTGTHASPKPHRRRGHWKTLSNPRFRHHPQYQRKIYVKPSFVGPRQVSYEGNIYRLVQPIEETLHV